VLIPAAALLGTSPARAAVVEPNGITVPAPPITTSCQNVTCAAGTVCENGRCEVRLQSYFDTNGEAISETADASTDPGVFLPLCDFAATLVLSESQAKGGLAWYNVPPTGSSTTAPTTIYQIGPFPMLVGQVITSADVRSNINYQGGLIGFVLLKDLGQPALSRVYYSEYQLNARCTSCTTPGNWKMALSYLSKATPNAYYLAFEDWEGADQNSWQGNDGDFNDKVFKISGVTCDGGGETCDTQMPGVCARGVTQCQVGAGITCKPAVTKSPEKCDNLDNDCNGIIDDGDGLCTQPNYVCSKGVCIPKCDDSEFPCAVGLECDTDGLCKDPRCANVDCAGGQVCQAGTCVGGCQGVTCPLGQICQLGICVDPCAGVSCPGAVCDKGACVTPCRCRACPSGQICAMGGALDGQCVDTGCDKITCTTGTICSKGACVDTCTNAVCPGGVACKDGMCNPPPPVTPTGQGGSTGATGSGGGGGFILTGRGGTTGSGGAAGGGRGGSAVTVTGTSGASGGTVGERGRGGTCSCEVAETPVGSGVSFLLAAAIVVARRRRAPW
jgi:hypothetical protein